MGATTNPRNAATLAAYTLGRGMGCVRVGASGGTVALRTAAKGGARMSAAAGGAVITVLSGVFHGCSNTRKWRQGKRTGKEAIRRTATESVGTGVATGIGLAASNLLAATVWIASATALVPFVAGAAAATAAKTAWDRAIKREPVSG
jgi:hypothetical protein